MEATPASSSYSEKRHYSCNCSFLNIYLPARISEPPLSLLWGARRCLGPCWKHHLHWGLFILCFQTDLVLPESCDGGHRATNIWVPGG